MKSVSWDFMVDWRKFRLLHELDRRGTITATAEAMYLTPSAVSQQLAALSRDVGVPLLERRGRTVVLTGQARLLLSHAESMRELADRTRAALDAWADGTVGQVRVGSLATGITALVGPAIAALRADRPGLTVLVSEREPDEALDLIDAGELDIAVTVDFPGAPSREDARYHRVDLIADVMDAVVPAGHPLAGRDAIEPHRARRRRLGGRRGERRVQPHRHRDLRRRGVLAGRAALLQGVGRRRRAGGGRRGGGAHPALGAAAAAVRPRRAAGRRGARLPAAVRAGPRGHGGGPGHPRGP